MLEIQINQMAEQEININNNLSDTEKYEQLLPQIASLISADDPVITNLSNFAAVIKESFTKVSWVGFYLLKNDILFLGPFQGKVACTQIKICSGVCGTAAKEKKVIVVENVNNFPEHIACDSGSKSEIVLPLIFNNNVIGVLDLDSYNFSAFNKTDEIYLTRLVNILASKINFTNFVLM